MARSISCDSFTCVFLLSVGLLFVAARWTRGIGRSPTSVAERGFGRLPARPERIANRVPGRLTWPEPRCNHTRFPESEIRSLEAYARLFDEAIEKIRLRQQSFRGRGGK